MRGNNSILAVFAITAALSVVSPLLAQGRRAATAPVSRPPASAGLPAGNVPRNIRSPKTPIDEFETLTPDQRRKALDRLPSAQRDKLQQRLQKFNGLPEEQQQSLKNLYSRLHELPPDRQAAVRKAVNRFSHEPPERQRIVRGELQEMSGLSQPERQARMGSIGFRKKFSRKEQGLVRDMVPLLPDQ